MSNYLWGQPVAFLLLIPWFGLIYLTMLRKRTSRASLKMSHIGAFKKWLGRGRIPLYKLNQALLMFSLLLLIVALARPQRADAKVKRTLEGLDIVIVLDISDSMLIEDMKPINRLESAKETLINFIKQRQSDRIGVVIFAGEAFTLVPPTLDYQLILDRVEKITTAASARIKDGTALGVAMASGAARLKDSQAKSRVMIFMTDGENNSGTIDPETGLEVAKGYGIKIYTIGIGRSGPTQIPQITRDLFGNKVKRYQPFESTVNDELLTQMADVTGGKYFRASKEDSLAGIFKEINSLETTKIEDNKYTRYEEFFPYFALLGLILFLIYRGLQLSLLKVGP
ncbi:MAG: VWA domain-containing protein [Bdellovibrionaceae bacterium]|nr:VWA domain-containing protein [Bdellovibrio sp.]